MEEKECCLSHKTKERSEKEYKSLINRLNRIEGQVRGIKSMVEKNAYRYFNSDFRSQRRAQCF